jgi:hypothetical protein
MNSLPGILQLPTGLDWSETWTMAASDGTAMDLSGYSYVLELREKDGATVITGSATVTDASAGEVTLGFTAEQIAELDQRIYQWVLIETDAGGNDDSMSGTAEVVDLT